MNWINVTNDSFCFYFQNKNKMNIIQEAPPADEIEAAARLAKVSRMPDRIAAKAGEKVCVIMDEVSFIFSIISF